MATCVMPASLQHIEEADEIGIGIGMRMIDRMAHTGLCCEMDHHREPVCCKKLIDRRAVREIGLQPASDVKADKARRTRDQYCLIRHRILERIGSAPPHRSRPLYPPYRGGGNSQLCGYCQIGFKTIPRRRSLA